MGNPKEPGFKKIDLHVHTPRSLCYGEPGVTAVQIVDAAIAAGLDAVGITDHNSGDAIEDLRRAGKSRGLPIFPGVELSTKGGHVLAIFDLGTTALRIGNFLDSIGVAPGGRGDAATAPACGTEELLERIEDWGGLAIAAHIERWPSGFLETGEPRRVKEHIHGHNCLSALEITVPENKPLWNNGEMPGYPRKHACIQSSDAHALKEIGRRSICVRMQGVDLEALRLALTRHQESVVFSNGCRPDSK